ncbi:cbb3-type cytochrome oxidase assembly protein CcoS [Peijinzhouia sedimentorum]
MEVIIILILFSVVIAGGFLAAFIWATRSGQYDDTYSPSVRMLFDDGKKKKVKKEEGLGEGKKEG